MALLLVYGVRTLTCRTVALSRALNTLSIQSLHTTVCSHRAFSHSARPGHFRSTSCSRLLVQGHINSIRQSCRCVTSRSSNNNVSMTFEEKTSAKCASLEVEQNLSSIGRTVVSSRQLEVGQGLSAEIKDKHSESEDGASVVFASEEQSHSTVGVSSDVSEHQGEGEVQSTQSSAMAKEPDCGVTSVSLSPGVSCGDGGYVEQTDNTPVYCDDGKPQCTDSAPVYFEVDKHLDTHCVNTTNMHVSNTPTVPNNAVPVPAAAMDTTCQHIENTTTTSTTSPLPTTTTTTTSTQPTTAPLPPPTSFTLAPYLAHSQVLQGLVSLGVDLSVVEKVPQAAEHLLRAEWASDIQPRLLFLRDLGVGVGAGGDSPSHSQSQSRQLGQMLNKNPLILLEDVEEMRERVSYLESKKFSPEQITRIVTFAPLTLLLPVHYVDKKLGFLQNAFHLTGDEVRLVATKLPKIIPWKLQKLKDIRFYMKDMLGFSHRELKNMLLASPRVYLSDRHQLGKRFDLLHNVMGLSHQHLAAWPNVFRTRLHVIEQRHRFLVLKGRAQYDPRTENYVSLQALVSGTDKDFCERVAKTSADQFYSFLRSL